MGTPPEVQRESAGRGVQIALVVLGVVVVLALLYFFLLRGDGVEPDEEAAPPPAPTAPEPLPTIRPGGGRVETFEVFAARDPFRPLVREQAAAGAPAAPGDDEQPAEQPGEQPGEPGARPGDGNGGGGGGRADGREVDGRRVRLVDVFTENGRKKVQVQVDGTVFTAEVGERFAENFEVLSIRGACATFLFGDDQFTLCEGEEILK